MRLRCLEGRRLTALDGGVGTSPPSSARALTVGAGRAGGSRSRAALAAVLVSSPGVRGQSPLVALAVIRYESVVHDCHRADRALGLPVP